MANFQTHLSVSTVLGAAYGGAAVWYLHNSVGPEHLDWGPVFLGAGLCALGGVLPDLDSDSGVPQRELFSLAAAVVPILMLKRLQTHFSTDQIIVLLAGVYLLIRYGLVQVFRRLTVHRGMFHSIPALLIAGLSVFLLNKDLNDRARLYMAGGVMLGFLSHLILDEIYAVNFSGLTVKLNKFAGSALKFTSPSWLATTTTYALLGLLGYLTWRELDPSLP